MVHGRMGTKGGKSSGVRIWRGGKMDRGGRRRKKELSQIALAERGTDSFHVFIATMQDDEKGE